MTRGKSESLIAPQSSVLLLLEGLLFTQNFMGCRCFSGRSRIRSNQKPKYCWCKKGIRPSVPCHHIREYRYAYGAVEPITGESSFLIMPYCNTDCMNVFLGHLASTYPDDRIILVCDGAAWHKSKALNVPDNIRIAFIPPYTPEMNPIEQIWKEIRIRGFKMKSFKLWTKLLNACVQLSIIFLPPPLQASLQDNGLLKRLIRN